MDLGRELNKQIALHLKMLIHYSLLKMRHEAKTAYSQNTVQRLKTYNKIKLQGVHKYVIYNDNYKHIKTK